MGAAIRRIVLGVVVLTLALYLLVAGSIAAPVPPVTAPLPPTPITAPVPPPVAPLPPTPGTPPVATPGAGQETMAGALIDNIAVLFKSGAGAFVATAGNYAKVIAYAMIPLEMVYLIIDFFAAGEGSDVIRIALQWLLLFGLAAWAITSIVGFANGTLAFISGMADKFSASVGVPAGLTPGQALSEGNRIVDALHTALATSILDMMTHTALGSLDPLRLLEAGADVCIDIAFMLIAIDLALANVLTVLAVDVGAIYVGFLVCRLTRGFALEYPRIIISAAMFQIGAHVVAGIGNVVATGLATTISSHSGLFGTPDFSEVAAFGLGLAMLGVAAPFFIARLSGGSWLSSGALVGAGVGAWSRITGSVGGTAASVGAVAEQAAEEDAEEWEAANR